MSSAKIIMCGAVRVPFSKIVDFFRHVHLRISASIFQAFVISVPDGDHPLISEYLETVTVRSCSAIESLFQLSKILDMTTLHLLGHPSFFNPVTSFIHASCSENGILLIINSL